MEHTWRYYLISPGKSVSRSCAEEFYAPDMITAFVLARTQWPSAEAWTLHGSRK